jgi:hypothetical protein
MVRHQARTTLPSTQRQGGRIKSGAVVEGKHVTAVHSRQIAAARRFSPSLGESSRQPPPPECCVRVPFSSLAAICCNGSG